MKNRNNEINIKINVSDGLLATLANIFIMANAPLPLRGMIQSKPPTGIPPSPAGFRVPSGSGNE